MHDAVVLFIDDISDSVNKQRKLETLLEEQERLVDVIRILNSDIAMNDRINKVLQIVGEGYGADRAYICSISGTHTSNTFEWCKTGIEPEMDNLQNIDISYIARWMPSFLEGSNIVVTDIEAIMKNVYFKMAGYDPADLERVLRIAAANQVDMVTFDGAGGGSGYSPCEMMNEWCLPTAVMESRLVTICRKLRNEGLVLPAITVTGGFASESSVFKALALGDGNVQAVGLCRAPMAAAMPLARVALYQKGVTIYISANTNDNPEWQDTIKHIAIEGHCWFINADLYFTREMYPNNLHCPDEVAVLPETVCRGGSCVVDPSGHYATDPVWDKENIIYCDLDMDKVPASHMEFDAVGHYARPDVLDLWVAEE